MISTDRVTDELYATLWKLAKRQMRGEPAGHTLQPTALIHEAYLRLRESGRNGWNSPAHFYGAAAEAMRRILIERARRYTRLRHGAGMLRVPMEAAEQKAIVDAPELLAIDEALKKLEAIDRRKGEVVKLRYFGGFTIEETAQILGVSPATVKLDWAFARAWLRLQMAEEPS